MSDNIIRVERHERNFTPIENQTARDKRLNAKERGVLVTILTLPPNWTIRFNALVRDEFPEDGRDAIRSAFRRLIDCGYITMNRDRDEETGRYGETVYIVREIPLHMDPVDRKKTKPSKNGKSVSGEKPTDGKSVSGDFSAKSIDGISVYGKPDPIKERGLEIKELKIKRDDDDSAAAGLESNLIEFPKKEWNEDRMETEIQVAFRIFTENHPGIGIERPLLSNAFQAVKKRLLRDRKMPEHIVPFLETCILNQLDEMERAQEVREERAAAVGGGGSSYPSTGQAVRPYL